METDFENKLDAICAHFREFARGWNEGKLRNRILDIKRFVNLNGERHIPLATRRKIARQAKALLESLDGLAGLSRITRRALEGLAQGTPNWSRNGGDRRSGQHSMEVHCLRMIVRAYIEAHPDPGFSKGGPLVRFVHGVCSLLGLKPPPENTIKATFKEIRQLVETHTPCRPADMYDHSKKHCRSGWYNQILKIPFRRATISVKLKWSSKIKDDLNALSYSSTVYRSKACFANKRGRCWLRT